jgi:hypothetical protein
MDPVLLAAIVGALGTVTAAFVGAHVGRSTKSHSHNPSTDDPRNANVDAGTSTSSTEPPSRQAEPSSIQELLKHPLFVGLVLLSLGGVGTAFWRSSDARATAFNKRLELATVMERWINSYTNVLMTNANPEVAYGSPGGVERP